MRARLLLALAALPPLACAEEAPVCEARVSVRLAAPELLQGAPRGDVAFLRVVADGAPVFEDSVDLGPQGTPGGGALDLVGLSSQAAPDLGFSESIVVELSAYSSLDNVVVAQGRTQPFACAAPGVVEVPVYLGPAGDFAATAPSPAPRLGATATLLDDGRVLVVGGDADGASAYLYDHGAGQLCDACVGNPPPDPLVGHRATLLDDGRVLVSGGVVESTGELSALLSVFDPATDTFTALRSSLSRRDHAAVLLEARAGIPVVDVGKVLVAGGADGAGPLDSLVLIDVDADVVEPLAVPLSLARAGPAGALLASGEVVFAGGRRADGLPSGVLDLFSPSDRTMSAPQAPCADGAEEEAMCAQRAGHRLVVLPDDNLLMVGGEVGQVGDLEPPGAEVFLLGDRESVPEPALEARAGHTVTALRCAAPPCAILVAGGRAPDGTPAPSVRYHPNPELVTGGAVAFGGTVSPLAPFDRRGAAAAPLPDGAVYLAGGGSATGGPPAPADAVFSDCRALDAVTLQAIVPCP